MTGDDVVTRGPVRGAGACTRRAGRGLGRAFLLGVALLAVTATSVDARPWGWLGVRIRDISEHEMDEVARRHGIREGFGVVIVEVIDDTPAARSGMKSGDIVVAFEGRPVTEGRLLQRLVASAPVDSDVTVTVLRPDGRQELPVRLAVMPRSVVGDRVAAELGFALRETPEAGAPRLGAEPGGPPAISTVLRGSPAERAGLAAGDLLLEVQDRAVLGREAAREALADLDVSRPVTLTVRRQGERIVFRVVPAPTTP